MRGARILVPAALCWGAAAQLEYTPLVPVGLSLVPACEDSFFTGGTGGTGFSLCNCEEELTGARVEIEGGYEIGKEVLVCTECREGDGYMATLWNEAAGVLELRGKRTFREYTEAVRSVMYYPSADVASPMKRLRYTFGEWTYNPLTDKFYSYVSQGTCSTKSPCEWENAVRTCADNKRDRLGYVGYLIALAANNEMEFVRAAFPDGAVNKTMWAGCSATTPPPATSNWVWATGPEACPPYDTTDTGYTRSGCHFDRLSQSKTEVLLSSTPMFLESACHLVPEGLGYTLRSSEAAVDDRKQQDAFVCEYGGIGGCLSPGFISNTISLNRAVHIDECARPQPPPADFLMVAATAVPLFPGAGPAPSSCADIAFRSDVCNCSTLLTHASLVIDEGYVKGDELLCARCDELGVFVSSMNDPLHGGDPDLAWKQYYSMKLKHPSKTGKQSDMTLGLVYDAVQSIRFVPSPNAPKLQFRRVVWSMGKGVWSPATGSYYDEVGSGMDVPWESAQRMCAADHHDILGLVGYLATITSEVERDVTMRFLRKGSWGWIGMTDAGFADQWRWVTGPEAQPVCHFDKDAVDFRGRSGCVVDDDDTKCRALPSCHGTGPNLYATGRAVGGASGPVLMNPMGFNGFAEGEPSGRSAATAAYVAVDRMTGRWYDFDATQTKGIKFRGLCEWSSSIFELCIEEAAARGVLKLIPAELHDPGPRCPRGQLCYDTDSAANGTWVCECILPATGVPATAGPALCLLDECSQHTPCGPGQNCLDAADGVNETGDWECRCAPPTDGVAIGAAAVCTLDECSAECATCLKPRSCAALQRCIDPHREVDSRGDWECRCAAPLSGAAVASNVTVCEQDECNVTLCGPGQTCTDPTRDPSLLGDFVCECDPPSTGRRKGRRAQCTIDECSRPAACGPGQACRDPDVHVPDDWVCSCAPPGTGEAAVAAHAACYHDECAGAGALRCDGAGQACRDRNATVGSPGDWECYCVAPLVGSAVVRGAASCVAPDGEGQNTTNASNTTNATNATAVKNYIAVGLSQEARAALADAMTPAAVLAGAGGPGAANIAKLAILRGFGCEVDDLDIADDSELDWEFHPTKVALTDGTGRYLISAAVMNNILIAALATVLCIVACAWSRADNVSFSAALADLRVPGILYIPFFFLLQGTTLVSVRMLTSAASQPREVGLGVATLVLCVAQSAAVVWRMRGLGEHAAAVSDPRVSRRHFSDEALDVAPLRGWRRAAYTFCFGRTVWVSKRDQWFCEKYGVLFESLRMDKTWWVQVELLFVFALSGVSVWKPSTAVVCDMRNILVSWGLAIYCGCLIYARPYSAALDNCVAILVALSFFVSVALMSIGIGHELKQHHACFRVAFWCLLVSAYVVAVKAIADVVLYLLDIYLKRRAAVRRGVLVFEADAGSVSERGSAPSPADGPSPTPTRDRGARGAASPGKKANEEREEKEEEETSPSVHPFDTTQSLMKSIESVETFTPDDDAPGVTFRGNTSSSVVRTLSFAACVDRSSNPLRPAEDRSVPRERKVTTLRSPAVLPLATPEGRGLPDPAAGTAPPDYILPAAAVRMRSGLSVPKRASASLLLSPKTPPAPLPLRTPSSGVGVLAVKTSLSLSVPPHALLSNTPVSQPMLSPSSAGSLSLSLGRGSSGLAESARRGRSALLTPNRAGLMLSPAGRLRALTSASTSPRGVGLAGAVGRGAAGRGGADLVRDL